MQVISYNESKHSVELQIVPRIDYSELTKPVCMPRPYLAHVLLGG